MYHIRANKHYAQIGDRVVLVDSNLEEKVLLWLEDNGFSDCWRRLDSGYNVGRNNYTPDFELLITHENQLHRALVEVKPNLNEFTPYISKRMRGIAKHYYNTQYLLLYVDKEDTWYRIDVKTGLLTEFGPPVPGDRPISKIHGPITVRAKNVYGHTYRKRARPILSSMKMLADLTESIIIGPKKAKRKARRKRRY